MIKDKTVRNYLLAFLILSILLFLFGCPPKPPDPPIEYVDVSVCSESGLLPNPYCPVTDVRKFEKGKEPTTQCGVHQKPPEPPVPIKLKKLLYVTALDLLTGKGDKERFIKRVCELGAGLRIAYQYSWNNNIASPYPKVATWKAGYADSPDMSFYDQGNGTWEGAKWDADYWKEFIRVHQLIKKYDGEVYGIIHEGCSFRMAGWEKYKYPFLSSSPDRGFNDPSYNKYPGGFWGLREHQLGRETVQILHELYIIKVVNTLNDIGVKYRLEFVNEDPMTGWDDAYVAEYYKWLADFFASRGVPKDHLIACGRQAGIPYVGLYSIHGIVRPDKIPDSQYAHAKILISGDGGFDGDGRPDAKGRKGISPDQASIMAQEILDKGYAGAEVMDRGLWRDDNDRADYDDWDSEPTKRFSDAWKYLTAMLRYKIIN